MHSPDSNWLSRALKRSPSLPHTDDLHACAACGKDYVNPGFERSWVRNLWLHREPAAQPIVTVGYREKIPPMKTPRRGLVLANTTQIFPEDRGTNYAVREGDEAARALLDWLP